MRPLFFNVTWGVFFLLFSFFPGPARASSGEAAYARTLKNIVRLNRECASLDRAFFGSERLRLAERQLPLTAQNAGRHLVLILDDGAGGTYLFKQSHTAELEEAAEFFFRMAGITIPGNVEISLILNGEKVSGSLQTFIADSRVLSEVDLPSLSARDIAYIQRQEVLDWLLSNFEAQFLRNNRSGEITGIDKDDAFWGIGLKEGRLTDHDIFNRGFGTRIYDKFWDLYKTGVLRVDLGAVFGLIDFYADLEDGVFAERIRPLTQDPYLAVHLCTDSRQVSGLRGMWKDAPYELLSPGPRAALEKHVLSLGLKIDPQEYLDLFLARKRDLRRDFSVFYEGLAQARGEAFRVPPPTAKFGTAVRVEKYLRGEVARRKARAARRRTGRGPNRIRVVTSPLGRHVLIRYAAGRRGKEETIASLKGLKETAAGAEESFALSIYLFILESTTVDDESGLLNRVVVTDVSFWNAQSLREVFERCHRLPADEPEMKRLLGIADQLNGRGLSAEGSSNFR